VPANETVNRVEIRGAAYGALDYAADGGKYVALAKRPRGVEKSISSFSDKTGGKLRFTNIAQETPIQEIWAYDVKAGAEPKGTLKLNYVVDAFRPTSARPSSRCPRVPVMPRPVPAVPRKWAMPSAGRMKRRSSIS
jgi:hypothetical protein